MISLGGLRQASEKLVAGTARPSGGKPALSQRPAGHESPLLDQRSSCSSRICRCRITP